MEGHAFNRISPIVLQLSIIKHKTWIRDSKRRRRRRRREERREYEERDAVVALSCRDGGAVDGRRSEEGEEGEEDDCGGWDAGDGGDDRNQASVAVEMVAPPSVEVETHPQIFSLSFHFTDRELEIHGRIRVWILEMRKRERERCWSYSTTGTIPFPTSSLSAPGFLHKTGADGRQGERDKGRNGNA